MPLTSFGVYLDDRLVTDYEVSRRDMLGISLHQVPVPGIVSFYEEHDARLSAGYTLSEWYNLTSNERATEVALNRIRAAIDYQKNKAQEREMERNSRKK